MEVIMQTLVDFLALALKLAVPIILGALAATLAERSGIICLGVEGMMLIGAFFGVLGSYVAGNAWIGVLLAIVSGLIMGAVYGVFCIYLRGQQVVIGVALNLFAASITKLLCKVVWDQEGLSETVATVPNITFPVLSKIPILGELFTGQSPYILITIILACLLHVFLYKTKYGLRIRVIGDYPMGAETRGINTNLYKMISMIVSGVLAALAGSYLSISLSNVFVANMTSGRGYMAVAANIFGGWTTGGSVLASLFFAIANSARYYMMDTIIPTQFVQMLPYVVTLIALVCFGRNSKSPDGLGKLAK